MLAVASASLVFVASATTLNGNLTEREKHAMSDGDRLDGEGGAIAEFPIGYETVQEIYGVSEFFFCPKIGTSVDWD